MLTDRPLDAFVVKSGPRRRSRRLVGKGGFTIVEVAVAAAVMLMAVSTCLLVLQNGYKGVDTARSAILAGQIMQSEIERIRLMSWADINNATKLPPDADVDISTFVAADPKIASKFRVRRLITPVTGREDSMVTMTVTVTWTNSDQTSHTRTLSTRYSKDGLYDYYFTVARSG